MISAGDIIPLAIEKPAAGGLMIARSDRLVVLVSGAIPGEHVRARVERLGKGVAYAVTVDVDEASADRRAVPGDPLCGGCLYAHIAYARQLELKALVIADALARIGGIRLGALPQVAVSGEEGYRMRARLHLRGPRAGFFREKTHEVCDARQTRQFLPETMDLIDRFVSALRSSGVHEEGELELSENGDASSRVVHLSLPAMTLDPRALDQLAGIDGLTGLSSAEGHERGDVYVRDSLTMEGVSPVPLRRHVLSFFQGNRYLLGPLVAHVLGHVPVGSRLVDLYAGVGLFAVAAAVHRRVSVTAVEGGRVAAADLAANCAIADGAVPIHRAVEDFVTDLVSDRRGQRSGRGGSERRDRAAVRQPDTIIVDPPRTGLSRGALEGVCRLDAGRLIYVSCDVATLARDARMIVSRGYAVDRLDAFDLFPNTPHIETVVVFQKG